MRVLPGARLQVVVPCDHHSYTPHNECDGPSFWITLDYDNPLVEVDCVAALTVEQVIHATFAALPDLGEDPE